MEGSIRKEKRSYSVGDLALSGTKSSSSWQPYITRSQRSERICTKSEASFGSLLVSLWSYVRPSSGSIDFLSAINVLYTCQ